MEPKLKDAAEQNFLKDKHDVPPSIDEFEKQKMGYIGKCLGQFGECFQALEKGYNSALISNGLRYKISEDKCGLVALQ